MPDRTLIQPRVPNGPIRRPSTTRLPSPEPPVTADSIRRRRYRRRRLRGAEQLRYRVARLSTARLPVLDAGGVDTDPLFILGRDRIVEPDTLDKPSPTPAAAVRNHHVVERSALRARTGESNGDHRLILIL